MDTSNNQYQVLSTLVDLDTDECRQVMSDYDSFMNRFQWKISMRTFVVHFRNAKKNHLKEDNVSEKKSLKRAMNIVDSDIITDEDLRNENLRDYITGTFLTSGKIMSRLHELGSKEL